MKRTCDTGGNPNVPVDLSWPLGPTVPSPVLPGIERRLRDAKIAKALCIEVDRGTGPGFLVADTNPNPNYTDSALLPTAPAKWKYRAIWQRDGQMLGQWTEWKEINVG